MRSTSPPNFNVCVPEIFDRLSTNDRLELCANSGSPHGSQKSPEVWPDQLVIKAMGA